MAFWGAVGVFRCDGPGVQGLDRVLEVHDDSTGTRYRSGSSHGASL